MLCIKHLFSSYKTWLIQTRACAFGAFSPGFWESRAMCSSLYKLTLHVCAVSNGHQLTQILHGDYP